MLKAVQKFDPPPFNWFLLRVYEQDILIFFGQASDKPIGLFEEFK
jgi:hypothetical protein